METRNDKSKTALWEVLIIVLIWLVVISLIYIVFRKAQIELKL